MLRGIMMSSLQGCQEVKDTWGIPVNALLIVLTIYGLSLIGWVWVWAWILTTLAMGVIEVYL